MQWKLDNSQAKAHIRYVIRVPAAFEVQLIFHVAALISSEVARKKLNIVRNSVNSTLAVIKAQLVEKGCNGLTKFFSLRLQRVVIQPYLQFNPAVIQVQLLSLR